MGCCGQNRTEMKSAAQAAPTPTRTQPVPQAMKASTPGPAASRDAAWNSAMTGGRAPSSVAMATNTVALRYLETTRVLVQGPASGRHYEFSASNPVQVLDARDVSALLGTRFFRRV